MVSVALRDKVLYRRNMTEHSTTLGALCDVFQGTYLKKQPAEVGVHATMIRVQHLSSLELSGEFASEEVTASKNLDRFRVSPGQVVVALRSWPLRASVVGDPQQGWVVNSNFAVLTMKGAVDPIFLAGLLRSEAFSQRVVPNHAGSALPSLSVSQLKQLAIPVVPMEVQRQLRAVFLAFERYQRATWRLLQDRERQVEAYLAEIVEGAFG